MKVFKPCLDVLPEAQKCLWNDLKAAKELGFTLYGGTAIALRIGHRESIDFDFFTEKSLDRNAIKAAFPFVERSLTIQDNGDTWVILVPCGEEHVKVSFFGDITNGRVGDPEFTEDGVLQVASLDDLMATKLKVILQRAESKDYRDIAVMIDAGVSLEKGLASARLLYGSGFQPSESVKALTYFGDGDLNTLSDKDKKLLIAASASVSELPKVTLRSGSLAGAVSNESQREAVDTLMTWRDSRKRNAKKTSSSTRRCGSASLPSSRRKK